MADELGTRIRANQPNNRIDRGSMTRLLTRDLGMTKLILDTATFTSANGRISGSGANEFTVFAIWDPIEVYGTNLNDGYFTVTGIDAGGTYLIVDPPPKDEGPVANVEVRTA
jgi:hypothetical protein